MDYKSVASALAKLGMNGDTELIHVNKTELSQIQSHLGRAPHINPHTGLRAFDDGGGGDSGGGGGESDHESGGSDNSDHGGDPGGGGDSPSEHGGGPGGSDGSNNADNTSHDSPSEHGNGPGGTGPSDASNISGDQGQPSTDVNQNLADVNPQDYSIDMTAYNQAMQTFSMPYTDIFSRGLASLTGIQLGRTADDSLTVGMDVNIGGVLGALAGGPIGGILGKAANDLFGIDHVTVGIGPNGVTLGTTAPDQLNGNPLGNAIARGANDLGFSTGVNSLDTTKTGSFADIGGAGAGKSGSSSGSSGSATASSGGSSSTDVASNGGTSMSDGGTNVSPIQQAQSDIAAANATIASQSAKLAQAQIFSNLTLGGATSSGAIAPFNFNDFSMNLPGDITPAEKQYNKEQTNKKKLTSLGDFIQNAAFTALAAPVNPFDKQSAQITPSSFVNPTQFA